MGLMKGWFGKLLILGFVTLGLCIALARIGWLVDERQQRQREAVAGVAQSQAGAQTLIGPLLLRQCSEEWNAGKGTETRSFQLGAVPSRLDVSGALNREPRYRGLFTVNGYAGDLQLDAQFQSLDALQAHAEHAGGRVQCEEPRIVLATSDARGLRAAELLLAGQPLRVRPGSSFAAHPRGLHTELPALAVGQPLHLQIKLQIAGTERFALVPAAAATQLDLSSDWPHPSFGGRFLPTQREVGEQGFKARWQVSELASGAAADVLAGKPLPVDGGAAGDASPLDTLEFAMVDPVNPYVMSDRAIKYGLLFIVLSFVSVGLVELLTGRRVHPVQYLLVGLALAIFFLLLLSVSEHLSFGLSYAIAAGAATLLLGHYGTAMLGGWHRGVLFGIGIAALYGALYVLLSMEQTALLLGALLLFAVLAVVMSLTRKLDWYALADKALERT